MTAPVLREKGWWPSTVIGISKCAINRDGGSDGR